MEAIRSLKTSVLTGTTRCDVPEDDTFQRSSLLLMFLTYVTFVCVSFTRICFVWFLPLRSLYMEHVSSTVRRMELTMNLKGLERRQSWLNMAIAHPYPEGSEENHWNLSQDSECTCWQWDQTLPEYKFRSPMTWPWSLRWSRRMSAWVAAAQLAWYIINSLRTSLPV
jgi:hypothetical protein